MNRLLKLCQLFLFLLLALVSCKKDPEVITPRPPVYPKTEKFTFSSEGEEYRGKIYIPVAFETDSNLPAIYLIDHEEHHFTVARDEFDQVVSGVRQLNDPNVLVVSLENVEDIEVVPGEFETYYQLFKDMTSYVDNHYTNNTSRTFIGRGDDGGVVLLSLLLERFEPTVFDNFIVHDTYISFLNVAKFIIQNESFSADIASKKLHFSYASDASISTNLDFIQTIEDAGFDWLEYESVKYADFIFEDAYPIAFPDGVKFIFDN